MESDIEKLQLLSLSARVTAFTHVFRLKSPTFFIRAVNSRPINIVVRNANIYEWIMSLEIGATYTFTRLAPSFLWKGSRNEIKVLEATIHSELRRMKFHLQKSVKDPYLTPASYVGKVSNNSLSPFGLIELEGGSILCTSFMSQIVNLPHLHPAEEITVYNTHSKVLNGVTYLVMCGRSLLISENRNASQINETMHEVVHFCLSRNFGFEDYLQAMSLFMKIEKLLESLSLSCYLSVLRERVPEVLESVYPGILDKMDHTSSRALSKEFFLLPHECTPMKQAVLEKCEVLLPAELHHTSFADENGKLFWIFKLLQRLRVETAEVQNVALVGKLQVDLRTGHLLLSGGGRHIQCVIPEETHFKIEVEQWVGKLVVIKEALQVSERFMVFSRNSMEEFEEKQLNYILLFPGSIRAVIKDEGIRSTKRRRVDAAKESDLMVATDECVNVEDACLLQCFVLHHASAPVIHESRVMFFSLVTLLGSPVEAGEERDPASFSRLCLICMQGAMLKHFPFLCENRVYEIRYPKHHGKYYFDKSFKIPGMGEARKILPYLKNGVLLPDNASLCGPFELPLLTVDYIINKEIYGVKDSVQHVAVNDVVHVKGILLSRNHQTSKYQNYLPNHGAEYGVPGEKNIILKLQDMSDNMNVNVYMIKWTNKQYPLGLLPGATICIKYIEKRCSSRSNIFFQSTCITSIKVLEYPDECADRIIHSSTIRRSYLRTECMQSLKSPFWTILSVVTIWSVEMALTCNRCGAAVIRGTFECTACAQFVEEPVIICKANISVEDGTGIAYLRMKNDHVRSFLGLSENEWEELTKLSMKKLMSYFRERPSASQQSDSFLDEDQLAFKAFCENTATAKLWKVVCRKFIDQEEGKTLKLFCLNVKEMDFDLAESLVD